MFSLPIVDIVFDQDVVVSRGSAGESHGCFVQGAVVLKLQEPTKVNDIVLKLVGTISLFTTDKGWLNKTLVKQKWSLLERSNNVKALVADTYQYRFNIFLPGSLPESIDLELGNIHYVLSAQVKRSTFVRDVSTSRVVTLRRDSLLGLEACEALLAHDDPLKSSLQHAIRLPTRTVLQGESIPLHVIFGHLVANQIQTMEISVLEHVSYHSSISAFQTVKQIAKFQFETQSDDSFSEKLLMLDLSRSQVRFSCNTSYIQVEHDLSIVFGVRENPDSDELDYISMNIPLWVAPKELQSASDELPPYSVQCGEQGTMELPSYDLISQALPQAALV